MPSNGLEGLDWLIDQPFDIGAWKLVRVWRPNYQESSWCLYKDFSVLLRISIANVFRIEKLRYIEAILNSVMKLRGRFQAIVWWAYFLVCFAAAGYSGLSRTWTPFFLLNSLWNNEETDPVLQFLGQASAVIGGIIFLPGWFAGLLLWLVILIAVFLASAILAGFYHGAVWLAMLSPAGAAIVGLAVLAILIGLAVEYRNALLRLPELILSVIAWSVMFFRWCLRLDTGSSRRINSDRRTFLGSVSSSSGVFTVSRKGDEMQEKTKADLASEKQTEYENSLALLPQDIAHMVRTSQKSGNWITIVIERITAELKVKEGDALLKLAQQSGQLYEAWRTSLQAQAGVLNAQDELEWIRAGKTKEAKNEEAEIRALERKRQKLTLENEILDLQKPSPTSRSQDNRSPEDIKFDRLEEAYAKRTERLKDCNGDKRKEAQVNLIYDDLEMRIKEGR